MCANRRINSTECDFKSVDRAVEMWFQNPQLTIETCQKVVPQCRTQCWSFVFLLRSCAGQACFARMRPSRWSLVLVVNTECRSQLVNELLGTLPMFGESRARFGASCSCGGQSSFELNYDQPVIVMLPQSIISSLFTTILCIN